MKKWYLGAAVLSAFIILTAAKAKELPYVIDPVKCTDCGDCVAACADDAIFQQKVNGKSMHIIDPAKCTGCGACFDVCVDGALSQPKPAKTDAAASAKKDTTKVKK